MTTPFATPADLYVHRWGEPLREALFKSRDGHEIRILKFVEGEGADELTLYRTSGVSDFPVPGAKDTHRQEFLLGCDPACDDVVESMAHLGLYSTRTGKALSAQNIYRSPGPLWEGTELAGFVITRPFEGDLEHTVLADGRHVEFLMLVPAFAAELDFASKHGIDALVTAQERAGVEFWNLGRPRITDDELG